MINPIATAALLFAATMSISPAGGALASMTMAHSPAAATIEQSRATLPTFLPPTPQQLTTLPEATYDAVVPSLIDAAPFSNSAVPVISFTLAEPITPVYGADRSAGPVAVMPQMSFTGQPTVVVPVATAPGGWTEVLTPSRNTEPSQHGGHAASQTAGWVRSGDLVPASALPQHIRVSVSTHTLEIVETASGAVDQTFPVGTGRTGTDSPLGITYIQARFADPHQAGGQPINLTSSHSAIDDHPYGSDEGLIALHYEPNHTAAGISHGCVRLGMPGSNALARLPVGTPVLITE
jgi:lipoprotein-anchoring transpeptidase ErfK/SrfK